MLPTWKRKMQSLNVGIYCVVVVITICVITLNINTFGFTQDTSQEIILAEMVSVKYTTETPCKLYNGTYTSRMPVDLRIIILTYDRPLSLFRLLLSLNQAIYNSERVAIDIWIDRSKSGAVSQDTVDKAMHFKFIAGQCNIHVHPKHVGIRGQWLDTWNPPRLASEMAVILEDDLTVSPYFFKYLKIVHTKYGHMPDVSGYTLQGQTIKHDIDVSECCVEVSTKHKVFLYPTLGTSGFAPKRLKWIAFKDWLVKVLKNKETVPLVPNHISSYWYTSVVDRDSMWEIEYLYYTWHHGEYTLYPNFKAHKGLVYNWFENGLHFTGIAIRKQSQAEKNLVMDWKPEYEDLPNTPMYVGNDGKIKQ